jgi:predicted metalloprotease with PDZ domain
VTATDGEGHEREVDRTSPYQWNISGHKGTVVVEYVVFGDRADGTYDGIDAVLDAHLNTPATFVWAHGMEKTPMSFRFLIPMVSKVEDRHAAAAADGWQFSFAERRHDDG